MLLQTLRHSRTLARWVLVWFVMAMGVAIAAPTVQPIDLNSVCSAAGSSSSDDGQGDGLAAGSHHTLQCVMCLGFSAPPQSHAAVFSASALAEGVQASGVTVAALAPRLSPLVARAPPQR